MPQEQSGPPTGGRGTMPRPDDIPPYRRPDAPEDGSAPEIIDPRDPPLPAVEEPEDDDPSDERKARQRTSPVA